MGLLKRASMCRLIFISFIVDKFPSELQNRNSAEDNIINYSRDLEQSLYGELNKIVAIVQVDENTKLIKKKNTVRILKITVEDNLLSVISL